MKNRKIRILVLGDKLFFESAIYFVFKYSKQASNHAPISNQKNIISFYESALSSLQNLSILIIVSQKITEKVGKTSWITSLVSDNHPDKMPDVIDPVVFTEMFVHTFQVSTVLIDTSSDILNQDDRLRDEVKAAQVILLLYDLSSQESIKSLKDNWMQKIESLDPNVPVIIIGNKRDMLEEIQNQDKIPESHKIEKVIIPLIKKYKQVQMGFECSALLSQYISDVIYGAHRAVLFPLSPLYDISQKTITPQFEKALARIFRMCDKDNDNKWSDEELRDFQFEVFSGELSISDIQGIKQLIREEEVINQNSGSSSTYGNEINFEGFKILQKKCVELMKMQICWAILRHFNYDDKLELDKRLFKDQLIVSSREGQTVELSGKANQFLINQCFKRFGTEKKIISGKDNSEIIETVLLNQNIQNIFFPYFTKEESKDNPFIKTLQNTTTKKDYILLEEWLCLWAFRTRYDYLEVYKTLIYIGYTGNLEETFLITNKTNCFSQIQKMNQRYVYHVCLIGLQDCYNELHKILMRYKKEKSSNLGQQVTDFTDFVTQVKFENGKKKIIIFTFVNSYNFGDIILDDIHQDNKDDSFNKDKYKKFDQIGLLYKDSAELEKFIEKENNRSSKFQECSKFYLHLSNENEAHSNPALKVFTREYIRFNSIDDFNEATLHKSIFNLIEKPTKGLDKDYIERIQEKDNFFRKNFNQILIGGGIIGILGIVIWIKRPTLKHLFSQIKKNLGI